MNYSKNMSQQEENNHPMKQIHKRTGGAHLADSATLCKLCWGGLVQEQRCEVKRVIRGAASDLKIILSQL